MKNQLTVTKSTSRPLLGLALAGLVLAGMAVRASAADAVIPPSDLPYGLSYEEWAAKWWQWDMGLETNHIPFVGTPDNCSGPGGNVRFLYGSPGSVTTTRKVNVSHDVSLFFPILAVIADNTACPVSDFTTNTGAELAAEVTGFWSGASLTTCTLDGVDVTGLEDPVATVYNTVSAPFSYTTAEKHSIYEWVEGLDCIPGGTTIYPAVTDGVYLMLAPLSHGKHTIHFVGVAGPLTAPFLKMDITYEITAE